MALSESDVTEEAAAQQVTRRDFLYLATGAMGLVAAGAAMIPLIDEMNPDAATLAAGVPIDVDLAKMAPGENVIVQWRSHPMFILKRSEKLLQSLRAPELVTMLRDPNSQQHQQPAYAQNWHRSIKPEFLVLVGICTHLGCIPRAFPQPSATTPAPGWPGGYFCPCHGSKYDLAGRVFKGVPAPLNLPVPPYRFVNDTVLRIGENPPGFSFTLESVETL